ncbi:MAG: TorF family putative porin [Pseudomonadota bacterium]
MKLMKKIVAGSLATALLAGFALPAAAEVSASASVATSYLWRGYDLGSGTPAASADISVSSETGLYAGLWISSGDTSAGTEYDLFAGYGGEMGDFTYDINLTSYIYPTGPFSDTDGTVGDFMELIVSVCYGPVSFSYYDNIAGETGGYAGSEGYTYITVGLDVEQWSFLVGTHDFDPGDATHFDISYAFNDNLAFTLSILDIDGGGDPEPTFVASYSIPIE